jgi:Fe-S-cluster-containing dehydrogenase component
MKTGTLLIDIDRCIRCHACEVACKQEHDLPAKPRWSSVVTMEPRAIQGKLVTDFVFTTCMHCKEPTCALVCPAKAIIKREDGIVIIDDAKCTGCGFCVHACPFGAMEINPEKKTAWKCSLCIDRLEYALEPSCVQHCSGGSLQYLAPEEFAKAAEGRHQAQVGKICYVSTRWKLST